MKGSCKMPAKEARKKKGKAKGKAPAKGGFVPFAKGGKKAPPFPM